MTRFPLVASSLLMLPFIVTGASEPRAPADAGGDPLPPHAVARIGTTRFRHTAYVSSLAFSPDGKKIASSTIWFDQAVWDAATGRTLAFRSRGKGLFRASVSPDGSLLAGRTDEGELGVQESLGGKFLHRFEAQKECCEGLVFSRDNRWLASADRDGNTFLWDLRAGKRAYRFETKPLDTFDDACHAFTPDGATFIQARPHGIALWDTRTGKEIRRIASEKEREWPGGAAVSPDGKRLAIRIAYGGVDLWEIATGRHLRRFAGHRNEVGPVFSPDGKHVVTGRKHGEIHFWEAETGKLARSLTVPPEEHPTSFAFSPDGKRLAVGGADHAIRVWDLASGKELLPVELRLGGTPSVRLLADGKTLLAHRWYDSNRYGATVDARLSFWDLQGDFVRQARLAPAEAHALGLSRDGRTAAYGVGPNFGPGFRPLPNGALRSSIRLCDVASGKELVKAEDLPCQIHDFSFSPDGRSLLVNAFDAGPDKDAYHRIYTLHIWKRKSPAGLEKVAGLPMRYFLSGYCVSPDSRWVVVTSERGYRFHDCETGRLLRCYPDAPGSAVAVSPSGRVLVSRDAQDARAGKVFVWERATGKTICELEGKLGQTDWTPLVVSPDGRFVAGCLDREVIALWDAVTGKQLGKLEGHRGDIGSLCFSPDGRFLVSASSDTMILIWDWRKKLPRPSNVEWSAARLERLGRDLQSADPRLAYRAIGALAQSPCQAIELLKKMPRPADAEKQHERWIDELDGDRFEVRETAMRKLTNAAELAEAALRRALVKTASVEARKRITRLLDKLPTAAPHPTTLATVRALELLEMIDTPDARKFIEEISRAPGDPLRKREAEETLERLKR